MYWRVAYSLITLRDQVNEAWPDRSKLSDGFIGDAAHASGPSDHNPNAAGVVCAFDITHDPFHGLDIADLFATFVANPHPDAKYFIANGQIAGAWDGFTVVPYHGVDPHTNHLHTSVGVGHDGHSVQPYDDTTPWTLPSVVPAPPPTPPAPPMEDAMQFIYARLEESPNVYLCNVAAHPRHFERFADAEFWAKLGSHTVLADAAFCPDLLGPDGATETRQGVLIKKDNTRARTLFGFTT